MGCDYYADGEGGELKVTFSVYKDSKLVDKYEVTVDVPDNGEVYRDIHYGGDVRGR